MAVTISLYNHTTRKLADQSINFLTLKLMLLTNSATFNATHTALSGPAGAGSANQVSGNGWAAGGEVLANVTVTSVNTNDAAFDADDVVKLATTGPIGPAYKAVLYDDSDANDAPLVFIDFGESVSAGESTDFKIIWSANGIVRLDYTL